jgi:hypothetical protein
MSALLHPIPSSRRHVIRVDIVVPVDVVRFVFWIAEFMQKITDTSLTEYLHPPALGQFKIWMQWIEVSESAPGTLQNTGSLKLGLDFDSRTPI